MSEIAHSLDALTPQQIEALNQVKVSYGLTSRSGERAGALIRTNILTDTQRQALTQFRFPKAESPRSLKAKQRKQLKKSIERLKSQPTVPQVPRPNYAGPPVHMGYDAEWVTRPKSDGWWNEILCVTCVTECGGRQSRFIFEPKGPARSDRITIAAFVQKALRKALKDGALRSLPDSVTIFGHFMRGDLATFADFWARKREFKGLGKTLASLHAHALEIETAACPAETGEYGKDDEASRSAQVNVRDLTGQKFRVDVRFVDTIKLTPQQRGLDYVGEMHGMSKLDLHADLGVPVSSAPERAECAGEGLPARYGKDRMDLVKRDFPEAFEKYAFRDSEIALAHGLFMQRFAVEELGLNRLPGTLAGCAAATVKRLSGSAELTAFVGREKRTHTYFDERKHKYRKSVSFDPSAGQSIFYQFACESYHGGRNECYYHGQTSLSTWFDYDLPGAYTTALVALRPVDYARARPCLDPDGYGIDDAGVAWITFEFPPGTRFPCIPVRGEHGLIFPLQGRAHDNVCVPAPEIFLARQMGARITVIQGFIAPWKSDVRLFETFTRLVQEKRREYPKSTHPAQNELWKEIGNSCYGLTAQGLKEKRVFDPATMHSQQIGPSALTEPLHAAWATSFIRAVLGEILWRCPDDGTVITATTDGLLTDIPIERLRLDGPLCTYFADLRERLFGRREVLDPEPKHGARQLISVAVRTTFTGVRHASLAPVCAKGGVKPPPEFSGAGANRYMRRLYLNQAPGMTVEHESFISAREQLTFEADLYMVRRTRRLNLRFDFKRRPVNARMTGLRRGTQRVAWDTEPWRTLEEANFARVRAEGWGSDRKRVFRDLDDFDDWHAFHEASWAMKQACDAAGIRALNIGADNAWGVLKRVFLQAGRQGAWGVSFEPRALASVAAMLCAAGFPTTKEDLTYAGRRKAPLVEHCVAWVPETERLLEAILAAFPSFDYRKAFCPRGSSVLSADRAVEAPPLMRAITDDASLVELADATDRHFLTTY